MKSIFLLCEYGIPYNTVLTLRKNNITLNNIVVDNNILDSILGDGIKKQQIIRVTNEIILSEKKYSVYDLTEYGLSHNIAESLLNKNIEIDKINENIKDKYHIGNATYEKINNALFKFKEAHNIKNEINEFELENSIRRNFKNEEFNLCQLVEVLELENFDCSNLEYIIDRLVKKNILEKYGNKYCLNLTINILGEYGVSNVLLNILNENKAELFDVDEDYFKSDNNLTLSRYSRIKEAYDKFLQKTNYSKNLTSNKMLNLIKNQYKNNMFKRSDVERDILINQISYERGIKKFNDLLKLNRIVQINGAYKVKNVTLDDKISQLEDLKQKNIIEKKLSGYTLEQIGNEYGITRERVRQILKKVFDFVGFVEEDELHTWFEEYNFDLETFTKFFEINEKTYYYLKEKYKLGTRDLQELLNNQELSENQKNIISKNQNLIKLYNEYVILNRTNILIAILKNNDSQVSIEDLVRIYNSIVEENKVLTPISEEEYRNLDSVLSRNSYVLNTIGRFYRYYNCDDVDSENIEKLKKLLDVEPGVYSTELFFKDNPLLMKELDVRDEYELHNLMRKIISEQDNVIYSRMPDVFIKCNDKDEFTESLIQELSPISIDEFVEFVYQNYGHKVPTFKAYLTTHFNKYININTLISDCPKFTKEQFEYMKEYLKDDIYSTKTIKKLLTDKFDVRNFKLLNSLNLNDLGYKLRGNYIMKSSISNLESYLRNQINQTDFYEISSEMKKIGSTFSSYLYKFVYDKKLFKYDENKYITLRKLNSMGISIDDINDFIDKINDIIPEDDYFNLYVLNADFQSKLFELNFPECFYETLIMIIHNIKTFRLNNNTIFIKTEESATREKFINSFINKDKIYINEIKNIILEKYNIDLQSYYIKEFINKNKYYLQNSTDCVYRSKEIYENEINQWDILQYID